LTLMKEPTSLYLRFTLNGSKLNGRTTSSPLKISKILSFNAYMQYKVSKMLATDGTLYYARLY